MLGNWIKATFKQTFNKFDSMFGLLIVSAIALVGCSVGFAVVPGLAVPFALVLVASLMYTFFLKVNGKNVRTKDLFTGFKSKWRIGGGSLLKYMYLFFWSLLVNVMPVLIIFTGIKFYEYSMTELILMKYPTVKASDAVTLSRKVTKGYKGHMFVVDFVGALAFGLIPVGCLIGFGVILYSIIQAGGGPLIFLGLLLLGIAIVTSTLFVMYFLNGRAVMASTILEEKEDIIIDYLKEEAKNDKEEADEEQAFLDNNGITEIANGGSAGSNSNAMMFEEKSSASSDEF